MSDDTVGGAVDTVVRHVREGIRRGRYLPGSRLPAERLLARTVQVSRSTVRTGLNVLADSGDVVCSPKRGWFVTQRVVGEPASVLQSFSEMAASRGLTAGAQILDFETRSATLDESRKLMIAPGSTVYSLQRRRTMDAVAICVDRTVLPAASVEELASIDLTDQSLYAVLEDRFDTRIERCESAYQAVAADSEVARLLGVAVGSPVLSGEEIAYAAAGRPVMIARVAYRGDCYRFNATLYRGAP
jgi:GntR family transcriptional regulator